MKLWTIQTIEWYEKFQETGIIYGEKEFVEPDFVFGYEWLIKQMEERIGPKPTTDAFPLWAWHTWESKNKRKPDLRSTAHFMKGTKGVRLEIEKDPNSILLSDFDLWHFPLSYYYYIGNSEADVNRFDDYLKSKGFSYSDDYFDLSPEIQDEIQKSWVKIFDLQLNDPFVTYKPEDKVIQSTFWSLTTEEVKKVDFFTAR